MTEGCLALTNIAESVLEDSAQFSDRMLQLGKSMAMSRLA